MYFTSVFTKEKDMDDGKIREGYVDILGHNNIKKEMVLGVLKNIKMDELAFEGDKGEDHWGLDRDLCILLPTGKVAGDWRIVNVLPLLKNN
eukprot:g18712.t1